MDQCRIRSETFLETLPFAELGLSPKVLAAGVAYGYTTATPVEDLTRRPRYLIARCA